MQGRTAGEFFICVNFFVCRDGRTEIFFICVNFFVSRDRRQENFFRDLEKYKLETILKYRPAGRRKNIICVNFFVCRDGRPEIFLFVSTFLYAGTDGRRVFLFVSTFLYAGTRDLETYKLQPILKYRPGGRRIFFICVNFFVCRDGRPENFYLCQLFLYEETDGRRIFVF